MPKIVKKDAAKSLPLTDEEFWAMFIGDLDQAVGQLIVQSGYLWDHRMRSIEYYIRSVVDRHGTVCVFLQVPRAWHKRSAWTDSEFEELSNFQRRCRALLSWGVHLNLRDEVHQKIALVDGKVLYEGSLNILSHSNKAENMRRFASPEEVAIITQKHGLDMCLFCNGALDRYGIGTDIERSKRIGLHIKNQRKNIGMSQDGLAARAKMSRSQIYNLEKLPNCSLEVLLRVLDALMLGVLVVPRQHILTVSSFVDRLITGDIIENPDRTMMSNRFEDVYRKLPFPFRPNPALDVVSVK